MLRRRRNRSQNPRLLPLALTKMRKAANHAHFSRRTRGTKTFTTTLIVGSKYYRTVEEEGGIKDYIGSQPEINEKMRSILIDLLVDVHRKFELMPETLYVTINLVDRFLSLTMVHRRYRKQVLAMEKSILGQVEWYITVPTPYVCLARHVKASVPCDIEMEKLVFYLAELGLMQYPIVVLNRPSNLATSAVYVARQILKKTPFWTETLKHHIGYLQTKIR
ncbi:hypothetical protein ARALYDRAFT_901476 [Arabidopsis lyrata subsp. lyrata]|uniref:Cyclin N-terminal domain-containing protein n=1 Tax=Arabidopsis lyrata subsp. lyrata TaxID=81972 RepID=D7LEU0_ARALL|nr:hypothetical protein ARALYDRAFT_901476 [Arabidopsis lyrata subsp. lyrata]